MGRRRRVARGPGARREADMTGRFLTPELTRDITQDVQLTLTDRN